MLHNTAQSNSVNKRTDIQRRCQRSWLRVGFLNQLAEVSWVRIKEHDQNRTMLNVRLQEKKDSTRITKGILNCVKEVGHRRQRN